MKNEEDKEEGKVPSDITSFYSPDISISQWFQKKEIGPAELQDDSKGLDNDTAMKLFPTEFVGWKEGDMKYRALMDTLDIWWWIEAEEEKHEAQEESLIQKNFQRYRSSMFPVRKVPVQKDLKVKIVLDWKLRNLSTEAVAKINLLTNKQVMDILFEFHQILNKTKKLRKFENLRRWKINQDHIACLQEFMNRKQITGFILWGVRNHLLSAFTSLFPLFDHREQNFEEGNRYDL